MAIKFASARLRRRSFFPSALNLLYGVLSCTLLAQSASALPPLNRQLLNLPANKWVRVQRYNGFYLQYHGSSVYDAKRGLVTFFGSDTHGSNNDNRVTFFDPFSMTWHFDGPASPLYSYRGDSEHNPVAGIDSLHPWAMHTYDAVVLDPVGDQLYVYSFPHHNPLNVPGANKRRPVTWIYDLGTHDWSMLEHESAARVDGFAQCSTYDPFRDTIMAYSGLSGGVSGLFEMGPARDRWVLVEAGRPSMHCTMDFDSINDVAVVFGWNTPESVGLHEFPNERRIVTPEGERLPSGDIFDAAFDPDNGVFLVVADEGSEAQTYVYDYAEGALGNGTYHHLPNARLPFELGLNHHLVFDPHHGVFFQFLVKGGQTEVHALRLRWTAEAQPPRITSMSVPQTMRADETAMLRVTAMDPDGDDSALRYTWSIRPASGRFSSPHASKTVYDPADTGPATRHTVTIKVTDISGASTSASRSLTITEPRSSLLLRDNFDDRNMKGWTVVDERSSGSQSIWTAGLGNIAQFTTIVPPVSGPANPGSYALHTGGASWTDYRFGVDITSLDTGFIGVMFRVQDSANYYRLRWHGGVGSGLTLEKRVDGSTSVLARARDRAYDPGTTYRLAVQARGPDLSVYINGQAVLSARDFDLTAGSVALYSAANQGSMYDNVRVEKLSRRNAPGDGTRR